MQAQKEFVTANGRIFECTGIETKIGKITARMASGSADEMASFFSGVTEFKTSTESEGKVHGTYSNLEFIKASIKADGSVEVEMRILSEQEIEMAALKESQEALKESQAEQDELLAGLMYGG